MANADAWQRKFAPGKRLSRLARRNSRITGAVVAALLWCGAAIAQECSPGTVFLRGDREQVRFAVEVAQTGAERARGLMFRQSMPRTEGMLFVFERPGPVAFWMKNTLIPLDMIFINESGVVGHVHHNAIPHDETPIPGGSDVFAVLEINAGMAATLGIKPGSELRHPVFAANDPAWPC